MIKRYKYRAYPTPEQETHLNKTFGCARVVYNDLISARETARTNNQPYPSYVQLAKTLITEAKKTAEREWLGEVSVTVLQQSLRDADKAYTNFFRGLKNKKRVGKPNYKSRRDRAQSIEYMARDFKLRVVSVTKAKLKLPKMGEVTLAWSRDLPSNPTSLRLLRDSTGAHYVSFVVEVPTLPLPPADKVTGIDLGLEHLAILASSDGTREKVTNPRYYRKAERKLKKTQKELSRKRKGSNNRNKARLVMAKAHKKVRETRLDYAHKLVKRVVNENQVIALETLSIKGLTRTRLAKSVHDASWGTLVRLFEEKAEYHNRRVVRVSQWAPTTQTCSVCGSPGGKKPLAIRTWQCKACGTALDRDYNAAVNVLLAAGLAESLNACGGNVRHELARAVSSEAGTLTNSNY